MPGDDRENYDPPAEAETPGSGGGEGPDVGSGGRGGEQEPDPGLAPEVGSKPSADDEQQDPEGSGLADKPGPPL